jgi:hypothetical protein
VLFAKGVTSNQGKYTQRKRIAGFLGCLENIGLLATNHTEVLFRIQPNPWIAKL